MLRIFFILLGIYILYRFIFDFFIPVYKASRRVHRQFQEMNRNMNNQQNAANPSSSVTTPGTGPAQPVQKDSDYIDFEEVK